jgi:hypothetical protein
VADNPEHGNAAEFSILHEGRVYKTFTVLKRNGEVTSMKIRDLAGV